jgi:hypothetical protein
MRKLALAVLLISSGAGAFVGCGGSSPRKVTTGTAGHGGNAGGTAGAAGGTAGDMGMAGGTAGTGGMAGGTAGTGGMAGGNAGAGGMAGAAGAAGTGGMAGAAGAAGTTPTPPPISSSTTVLEIDDVVVALTATPDAGTTDAGADAADGSADASTDGGADGGTADAGTAGSSGIAASGVSYTFDTGVGTWHFTPYGSTNPAAPNDPTNLAKTSTLSWSSTDDADGKTTSGSLKGNVLFQHDGDQIDFQAFSVMAGMFDWSAGYTVTAKVRQVSGGNLRQNCPLSAVLYVSEATDYNTTLGPPVNLVPGQWTTVTYDISTSFINKAAISQLGLQINTGAASACTGPLINNDAGTDSAADAPVDGGSTADAPADTATTTDAATDAAGQ